MNVDLLHQIYKDLKQYLQDNSQYSPRVLEKSKKQSDKFPLVTIVEDDNVNTLVSTTFKDKTDSLSFSINIYAQDKPVQNETISDVVIARELMKLVDDIMGTKYRMQRVSCRPTPNLDSSIYRITMKYSKKMIVNKNILI